MKNYILILLPILVLILYLNSSQIVSLANDVNNSEINDMINQGYVAKITSVKNDANAKLDTNSFENSNCANVSAISDFIDYKNRYTVCYEGNNKMYITIMNENLKPVKTLEIPKKYPLFGGVIGDRDGNYYIAWGQQDNNWKWKEDVSSDLENEKWDGVIGQGYMTWEGGVDTFAISKYTAEGNHVKTCPFKTTYYPEDNDSTETRVPFRAGNCAMAIQDDILICSYARLRYDGHQGSTVVCVNMESMTEYRGYIYHSSHSFDQRVLALKNGGALFASHSDGIPTRGFALSSIFILDEYSQNSYDMLPFHFYGEWGDNYTNASLGDIGEASTGYVLVAASAKSMEKNFSEESQNIFMQIIDNNTHVPVSLKNGTTRSGICMGQETTDTGILWLTNYKDGTFAVNPKMAVDENERIIVMWEKVRKGNNDDEFIQSYYMVISSTGEILQKATPMNKIQLCRFEEINYCQGYVYWSTADGTSKKITSHKMKIGELIKLNITNPKAPKKVKISAVKVKGKIKHDRLKISWKKVKGQYYQVQMSKKKNKGFKTIKGYTKNMTKFTKKKLKKGTKYYFRVRTYKIINGKKYYSKYSAVKGKKV